LLGCSVRISRSSGATSTAAEQAKLQLTRAPLPLPTLQLNPEVRSIDSFRFEDIVVAGYQSHPSIKAPIAV
jgi:thymidylate synthase